MNNSTRGIPFSDSLCGTAGFQIDLFSIAAYVDDGYDVDDDYGDDDDDDDDDELGRGHLWHSLRCSFNRHPSRCYKKPQGSLNRVGGGDDGDDDDSQGEYDDDDDLQGEYDDDDDDDDVW